MRGPAGQIGVVHWLLGEYIDANCDSSCYDYLSSRLFLTAYKTWALLESVDVLYLVVAQASLSMVLCLCLFISSHRVSSILGPSMTVYLEGSALKFIHPAGWVRPGWVDVHTYHIFLSGV